MQPSMHDYRIIRRAGTVENTGGSAQSGWWAIHYRYGWGI